MLPPADDTTSPAVKRGSAFARTAEVLRGWIRDGSWAKGEFVPSERDLAASLNVNRPLIHRAMVTLQSEGLVRRVGSRFRVASRWDDLMQGTIIVIGNFGGTRPASRPSSAGRWVQYLEQGVVAAVSDTKHNAVTLHPERMNNRLVEQLIEAEPTGVVITECLSRVHREALDLFAASAIPVVAYTGFEKASVYDRIYSNHEVGAYEITRWMINQGRRRLVQVFGHEDSAFWVRSRQAGYQRAMREAGLEVIPAIQNPMIGYSRSAAEPEAQFELGRRMLTGYLAQHLAGDDSVDGILAESDSQAFMVSAACRLLGREPHSEIAIAGYDNTFADSPFAALEPKGPQVTADKRNLEMGFQMVSLLMQRISGELPQEPQDRLIGPELVVVGQS